DAGGEVELLLLVFGLAEYVFVVPLAMNHQAIAIRSPQNGDGRKALARVNVRPRTAWIGGPTSGSFGALVRGGYRFVDLQLEPCRVETNEAGLVDHRQVEYIVHVHFFARSKHSALRVHLENRLGAFTVRVGGIRFDE